jgi:hypothetical protein
MAEQSIGKTTDEIYERRNEKGKEMQNYQDAEKQLLAIQAAQQQNLQTAKMSNLAQYQNNQNLAAAGNVLSQTQNDTQQVAVNPTTQQVLQKYGAVKPGTVTKSTHSQQVTKQNITINNNTTTTTNNQVTTPPSQPQVVRPQRDNSSEKFKIWLNNTLARQQEDYARREKDYDKRESALTRDSNKMLRKLGEFSKDMMERMDPRKIGSTATSQIKTLLFMFGFQYLASNWSKILKTVASIEGSFKRGLAYFGLYNLKTGNFEFSPGKSQLAYDISGLFSGTFLASPLMLTKGGGGKTAPQIGGEGGMIGGLRKILVGNLDTGGKDKGLIELIKEFFVNQGKKRIAAAKMIEKPEFSLGNLESTLRNLGDYFGQLLGIFLGDPDEAVRNMMKSKISITAAQKAWSFIENNSTGEKKDEVDIGGRKYEDIKQGAQAYFQGEKSQRGLSLGALDRNGELRHTDAEGSLSQSSDLVLVKEDVVSGKRIDTERYAAGMSRMREDARANGGKTAVMNEFLSSYLTEDEIQRFEQEGKIKRNVRYNYAIRDVDVQDDYDYNGFIGKEQEKELDDYLKNGILGDNSSTAVKILCRFLPAGAEPVADFIYRLATGKFNGMMEIYNAMRKLENFGSTLWFLIKHLNPAGPVITAIELWNKFFGKDPNKPGMGTEKRKVLVSDAQLRSSDIRLAGGENVNEISEDVLNYIDAKGGITTTGDITNTEYYNQVQNSLASTYAQNNKTYSNGEANKTFKTSNGEKKEVHLSAEENSILENTGYYVGNDKDYAQFINEKRYRNERDKGNKEFDDKIFKHVNYSAVYSGVNVDSYDETFSDFYKQVKNDTSLMEYLKDERGLDQVLSHMKFHTSYDQRDNPLSNRFVATDSEGKTFDYLDVFNSLKDSSPEKIKEFYDRLANSDFNARKDVTSTLLKNNGLKTYWSRLFTGVFKKGLGNSSINSSINIEELLKDPEGYGQKLINAIQNSFPQNPQHLYGQISDSEYQQRMTAYEKSMAEKTIAIKHIQNLVSYLRSFINNADRIIGEKRKGKVLEALSKLINSRTNAVAIKAQDLQLANEYTTNTYKRTVAAANNNMLRMSYSTSGGAVNEELDRYNNWSSEWTERDAQYQQDLKENVVTNKAVQAANFLKGKFQDWSEVYDEYSEDTKNWLGGMFNDAKGVVNNFLKDLDYTKVSLAKWPNGYLIKKESKLLLWHCFNNNPDVVTNFRVLKAGGRFGAGRTSSKKHTKSDIAAHVQNWDPHTDSEENRKLGIAGLFDRLHAGQDISAFEVTKDGKISKSSTFGTPFYAPFGGYVKKVNTACDNGGGRYVLFREKKEGGTSEGRYCIFVCHLSEVSQQAINAFKNESFVAKGTELGKCGRSGYKEDSYIPHFHVNILDTEKGGPFDYPLEGGVKGVVSTWKGHSGATDKGAVDPLFVFCNDTGGDISNKTLYLSTDRKVVNIESKEGKDFNKYKGGDLDFTPNPESGENKDEDDVERNPDGTVKEKDSRTFLDKVWDWLKDTAFKIKTEILEPSLKEAGEVKSSFVKAKLGNTGMSFTKSSYSYSGQVTPEFVNYQNYLKNAGKIGLGTDGKPLSETEWRNQVYDMTGSDPVSLKLGEYLNHGVAVKSANQLNGDAKNTINKYTENNTESTVNVEGSTDNKEVSNVEITNNAPEEVSKPVINLDEVNPTNFDLFGGRSLADLQNDGHRPFYKIEKATEETEEHLEKLLFEYRKQQRIIAQTADALLAGLDRQAGISVAGIQAQSRKPNVTVATNETSTGNSNVN